MGKRRKQERDPVPFQSINIPSKAVGGDPPASSSSSANSAPSTKPRATSASPIRQRRRSRSPLNFIRRTFSRSKSPLGRAPKPNNADIENRPNGVAPEQSKRKIPLFRSQQASFKSSTEGIERIAISSASVNPSAMGASGNGISPSSISALTQPTLEDEEETTFKTDEAVARDSKDGRSEGEKCQVIFRTKPHSHDNHDNSHHRVKVTVDNEEQITIIPHSEETEIVFESKSNKKTKLSTATVASASSSQTSLQQSRTIQQSFSQGSESSPVTLSPGGGLFERAWTSWNPSSGQSTQLQQQQKQTLVQETSNALVHVPSATGHFLATRASNTQKPRIEGLRYTLTDANNTSVESTSMVQENTMDTSSTSIVLLETSGDQDDMSVLESFGAAEQRAPPLPTLSETQAHTVQMEEKKQDIPDFHAMQSYNEDTVDTKMQRELNTTRDESIDSYSTSSRGPMLDFSEPPCKIFLLLLDPKSKIFELIQLIYPPSTTTLGEILSMIPHNATEPALAQQRYTGLIRPRSRASPWTDKRVLMNSKIGPGEILVAIPYEYATKYVNRLGRQILNNPRIKSLLETSNDPLLKPPTSKRRHRSKSPGSEDSASVSRDVDSSVHRKSPVTTVFEEETEDEGLVLENSFAKANSLSLAEDSRAAGTQFSNQQSVSENKPKNVVIPNDAESLGESTMVTAKGETPKTKETAGRREEDISYGRACGPLVEDRIHKLRENFRDSPTAGEDFAHLAVTPTKEGITVFDDDDSPPTTPPKESTPQELRDIGPDRRATIAAILPQRRYLDTRPRENAARDNSRSKSSLESTPPSKQDGYATDDDDSRRTKDTDLSYKSRRRFSTGTPTESITVDDEKSIGMSYTSWSQSVDSSLALRYSQQPTSVAAADTDDDSLTSFAEKKTAKAAVASRSASFSLKKSARLKKKIAMRQIRRFFGVAIVLMVILYALDTDKHHLKVGPGLRHPLDDSPLGILGFVQFLLAFAVLVKFQLFLRQSGQESKCPFMIGCSEYMDNLRDRAKQPKVRTRKAVV